ncbi:hypothetical protein VTO42DRAFT_7732 [Malbranchea cinnamomea]
MCVWSLNLLLYSPSPRRASQRILALRAISSFASCCLPLKVLSSSRVYSSSSRSLPMNSPTNQYSYSVSSTSTVPHVGVIGAGLSGLRCADILLQRGVRVTILEARDRVGGRVYQSHIGGIPVDLGPNWIHGTEKNPIADLSKTTNTVTHSWEGAQAIIDKDGHHLDKKAANKVIEFMWTTIDKAFEYSRKNSNAIPASKSLFDYFVEELENTKFDDHEKEACLEFCKLWGSYIGAPVDRQSLKFFFLEECIEGNNLFLASTYKNILDHIAKPALEGAEIHLNDAVVGIEGHTRKPGTKHEVKVTTAAGKHYNFDEVVVTLPLGVLKQTKTSLFTPPPPERLSKAIDSISYGGLEKVYVHFPTPFWHVQELPTGGPRSETELPAVFTQFMTPNYTPHPPTPFWNPECVSLAALPTQCAHPTLLFYFYPPFSTYIVTTLSSLKPHSPAYNDALTAFLQPYYSRLPNYSPASPDCQPLAFLATSWQTDPYAGNGSYSNFQVGLEEGDRDIEVMREGMGMERGVWLAGEHTAPFVALGTTVGAYWSGEEVAGRVCDMVFGSKV